MGAAGFAVLVGLGIWQTQRLTWKEAILERIDREIAEVPIALPDRPVETRHNYLSVRAEGRLSPGHLRVLTSIRGVGPGHRIIAPFQTEDRRIMLDLGFLPDGARLPEPPGWLRVHGNLHWPDEHDRWFTPEPDAELWFARQVDRMAGVLETEPVMLVVSQTDPTPIALIPLPVDSSDIANDHFQYAVTWFSLATVWLAMTAYWLRKLATAPPDDAKVKSS